jgi:ABC-type transporter Mla subunit MlaD
MEDSDALLAVLAHGLLGSMASIKAALGTLRTRELTVVQQQELLNVAATQIDHVIGVLTDLIAGVQPELTHTLNTLSVRDGVGLGNGELLG